MAGSWFRELRVLPKNATPPVETQLAILAQALQPQDSDRGHPKPGDDQAYSVAALISALDSETDALIQVGSVLLIKVKNNIFVRNLTHAQLDYFNHNPALFQNPKDALLILQRGQRKGFSDPQG